MRSFVSVGRTSTTRTDVRDAYDFTYDGSYKDHEDDTTEGLNGRNRTGFKTPVSVTR